MSDEPPEVSLYLVSGEGGPVRDPFNPLLEPGTQVAGLYCNEHPDGPDLSSGVFLLRSP